MAQTKVKSALVPKQCLPQDPANWAELMGAVVEDMAVAGISFLPGFSSTAVIHDNGCGPGTVTKKIMATNPPKGITIKATDFNPHMLASYERLAKAEGWPSEATIMPSESLTFPDNYFTQSFTDFVLYATTNEGIDAVKEIYRTLRPNGTAVIANWTEIGRPHAPAMKAAHAATRGSEGPLPMLLALPYYLYSVSHLQGVLEAGGFQKNNIRLETVEAYLDVNDLKHWATIIWSYMGLPATGWLESDEENWDKAISVMMPVIEESPGFRTTPSGGCVLTYEATVAILTK